jgi:hypothetical protein
MAQGDVFRLLERFAEAAKCFERAYAVSGDVAVLREVAVLNRDCIEPPDIAKVRTRRALVLDAGAIWSPRHC